VTKTDALTRWRKNLSLVAEGNRARPGVLATYISEGVSLGEDALEALLYLAGSEQYQVRLSVCETLSTIAANEMGSDSRRLLMLALEDFLADVSDAVRFSAKTTLQNFLAAESKQIWGLFPSITCTDPILRTKGLESLNTLPCSAFSKLMQDPSDLTMDCLRQAYLPLPPPLLSKQSCVVTLGRPGESACLERLLGRLETELDPIITDVVVLNMGDEDSQAVAQKFGAKTVLCRPTNGSGVGLGPLFSAARAVSCAKYVCIDPLASISGSLSRLLLALDAIDEQGIFVYCTNNTGRLQSRYIDPLEQHIVRLHGGVELTSNYYPMTASFFAGYRASLLALDAAIRVIAPLAQPPLQQWESELFSLAAGSNERHVPLSPMFAPVFDSEAVHA